MTRPESHRIDERAKRIFESSLPDSWVPREQYPDYRIDYTVEIFNEDEPSGLSWNAQLKGSKKPKRLKGNCSVSFSMEVSHLEYFMDKVLLPVFLVVVDTVNENGWWVFLQQYIKTQLKEDWRNKSTVAIRIPLENSLADPRMLLKAVSEATTYMRELHPSSIFASINAEKKRLENLDPRFDVDIKATEQGTHYSIAPKEQDIELGFQFQGEKAVAKAKGLIESGGKQSFAVGEAKIEGLAKEWNTENDVIAIEVSNSTPVSIRFIANRKELKHRELIELHGNFVGGTKRGEFRCELQGGLIKVVMPIDGEKTSSQYKIDFDFTKWLGVSIREIPYLDAIHPFFELLSGNKITDIESSIEIEGLIKGNRLLQSVGDEILTAKMKGWGAYVIAFWKAREVVNKLGITATVPEDLNYKHIQEIDLIYELIVRGVYKSSTPNAKSTLKITKEGFELQKQKLLTNGSEMTSYQGGSHPFLSTQVDIGYQKVTFSAMTLDESQTEELDNHLIRLVFEAEDNCTMTLQQCNESEVKKLDQS